MNEYWTDEELEASVVSYIEMLRKEHNQEPFVKNNYYRDLANKFGRSEKATQEWASRVLQARHTCDGWNRTQAWSAK